MWMRRSCCPLPTVCWPFPVCAVNRGNTVLITSDSPSAVNALEQEAPEGYVYVQVTTGVSDDSYIEITSGLQEGDTVAYLRTSVL